MKQRLERHIEVDKEPSNSTLPVLDAGIISEVPDKIQEEIEEILPVSTAKFFVLY
jgi:hypothetical protein